MLNLLYAASITILSNLYLQIYRITGRECFSLSRKARLIKTGICFLMDLCLLTVSPAVFPFAGIYTAILFLLIADFDILIMKIPTELLLPACILGAVGISGLTKGIPLIVPAVLFFAAGLAFSKKTGIALYDMILAAILAMRCPDILCELKFFSLFLVLWGLTGLAFQFFRKNTSGRKIPLAPVILAAYAAALLIGLR